MGIIYSMEINKLIYNIKCYREQERRSLLKEGGHTIWKTSYLNRLVPESFIAKMILELALKNCSQEYTKKKTQAEDLRQESI